MIRKLPCLIWRRNFICNRRQHWHQWTHALNAKLPYASQIWILWLFSTFISYLQQGHKNEVGSFKELCKISEERSHRGCSSHTYLCLTKEKSVAFYHIDYNATGGIVMITVYFEPAFTITLPTIFRFLRSKIFFYCSLSFTYILYSLYNMFFLRYIILVTFADIVLMPCPLHRLVDNH